MSNRLLKYFLLLFFAGMTTGRAQETPDQEPEFRPTVGLGTGVFSFYGEISNGGFQNPMLSRIGYDLSIGQDLTHYLNLRFYTIFGKLGSSGVGTNRSFNFESAIRAGGVNLTYNFGNFLKPGRLISPFIVTGIESFEFLSKTDLYDDKGNKYHYWSDGSIRNIDESSPDAEKAIFLSRDYKYESDIRELNLDGFGKYPERSWAIPIGAGIFLHLSDRVDFKIGTTLHITKTDLIDGRTSKSIGERIGNKENDRFLMSSVALHFNLTGKIKQKERKDEDMSEEDLLALDNGDQDNDGVNDYKDRSPFTPAQVSVDTSGVPLDSDNDRVFDYMDKQTDSPTGSVVTSDGVALTDSLMEVIYLTYLDSTGQFGKKVVLDEGTLASRDVYVVKLGEFKSGVPPETINKFLSIKDINSVTTSDSVTVYSAGRFYSYKEAEERKKQLEAEGITDASIALHKNNKFTTVSAAVNGDQEMKVLAEKQKNEGGLGIINSDGTVTKPKTEDGGAVKEPGKEFAGEGVIYRVQVGAYKRKLSKQIFSGLPDLVTVTSENGVTKYLTGTFTDYNEAAKHKVDLLVKGYQGAFVVAFKDGKRANLNETGVKYVQPKTEEEENKERSDNEQNAINKDLVTFKVQVGVFKNEVPADILEKFSKIKGLEGERTPEGLTRYTVGGYKTYAEAVKQKNELKQAGIEGAFVVAFFKDRLIDVQEGIELTK